MGSSPAEQVQRRAARYVCNDYTTHTPGCVTTMVEDIGWESLQDRRYTARLSLLYKIQHGLVDIESSQYLRPSDSRTRGQRGLFQERINCVVYFNSFFPRTIRNWNELPRDITEISTLEEFRTSLAGLGKCRHLRVKAMPLAFTGIFRNNPEYSGITWHFCKKNS